MPHMRRVGWLAAAVLISVVSACGPTKVATPSAPGAPRFPDYIQPTVPAAQASEPAVQRADRAWQLLQAGDLRGTERELTLLLKERPTFFPAQTTAAYLALARKDGSSAVTQFTRVTEAHPDYVPALVGRGLALQANDQNRDAIEAFRAALRADPSLSDIARRVDVLTLRALQDELAAARQAARAGQAEPAMRAYRNAIAASPDSAFLYRELAAVERQHGQTADAIEHLKRANALEPTDPASFVALGELLEREGDLTAAVAAYTTALRLEPDATVEAKRAALRAKLDQATLPEEYRAIEASAQITRADLAALIGVRLAPIVQSAPSRDPSLITDIRGHWAERWIAPVAKAGLVENFVNHTFQPRTVVRRVDLAQSVARILNLIAVSDAARAKQWVGVRGRFPDVPSSNLAYAAVSSSVAAGVLTTGPDGAFAPTRPVTGAEAVAAIARLRSLGRLPAGTGDRP